MLPLFFLMIMLNAFLLYTWLKRMATAESIKCQQCVNKRDGILALQLVICIVALLLWILNYYKPALLLMAFPVSVAGLLEVILPMFAGIFKFKYRRTIFFNRSRKIIFD